MDRPGEKFAPPHRQTETGASGPEPSAGQRRRGVSKCFHILDEDPTFRAWLANVARASHNTGAYYFLRRYFDTRMMLWEVDGPLIPDWRAFWMGHSGNIEFAYTLRKGLDEGGQGERVRARTS